LDNPGEAASVIEKLSARGSEAQLMAYQIGFDLYESATQNFLARVLTILKRNQAAYLPAPAAAVVEENPEAAPVDEDEKMTDVSGEAPTEPETVEVKPPATRPAAPAGPTEELKKHWEQMIQILSGEVIEIKLIV